MTREGVLIWKLISQTNLIEFVLLPQVFSCPAEDTVGLGPNIPLFRPANEVNLIH